MAELMPMRSLITAGVYCRSVEGMSVCAIVPAMGAVRPFPTRHKCAALPWDALRDALKESESK